MRDRKYRVWSHKSEKMYFATLKELSPFLLEEGNVVMDFTGKQVHDKRDLYEGDILFYEETTDNGDERFYLVTAWISEWSMFATLFISEYLKYMENGIESIDESMYWTFVLHHCENYHYAGNIYENPDLITTYNDEND